MAPLILLELASLIPIGLGLGPIECPLVLLRKNLFVLSVQKREFHHGRLYPQLASTMDADVVQYLIVERQAMPLPPDFCNILDSMFHWGRAVHSRWYHKCLVLCAFYLRMEDLDRAVVTTRQLSMDVIQIRVLQMLEDHFVSNPAAKSEGFNRWLEQFNDGITSTFKPEDFFGMATASISYTNYVIDELVEYPADSGDESEPTPTSDMALPDIVASSP